MKVNPYHTKNLEEPPQHRNVYHDHNNCPYGSRIKPENKLHGDGGYPRCSECKKLD